MAQSTSQLAGRSAYQMGAFSLLAATAVILAALGFEHLGGFDPCQLCLQQRYAYYVGIPLLFIALVSLSVDRPRLATGLFALASVIFLLNAGFGVYHSGIEWKLWEGPATCASGSLKPLSSSGAGLLKSLATRTVASCGEAQVRFLGLSFAGWNVIACLVLMTSTLKAAFQSSILR